MLYKKCNKGLGKFSTLAHTRYMVFFSPIKFFSGRVLSHLISHSLFPFQFVGQEHWFAFRKIRFFSNDGFPRMVRGRGAPFRAYPYLVVRCLRWTLLYADTLCPRLRTTPERSQVLGTDRGSFSDRKTTRAVLI